MNHQNHAPAGDQPTADHRQAGHREAAPSDFAPTRPDEATDTGADWWPESADGQCSQSAALFAASQPAPLNVV